MSDDSYFRVKHSKTIPKKQLINKKPHLCVEIVQIDVLALRLALHFSPGARTASNLLITRVNKIFCRRKKST